MSNERDCKHGNLARVCDVCELTEERDALAALVERMREAVTDALESGEDGDWQSARRVLTAAPSITPSDALRVRDTRKAAEVLREAADSIGTIDDGGQPAYRHCQEHLRELAAAKERGE